MEFCSCSNPACDTPGFSAVADFFRCSKCQEAVYCGNVCQTAHATAHREICSLSNFYRLAIKLLQEDQFLNAFTKDAAQCESRVEGVGKRRAVTFDFPDVKTLEQFIKNRGTNLDGEVMIHHLSPSICEKWVQMGDQMRGREDCLSIENVTLTYVREYNPEMEAVVVFRLMLGSEVIARPFKVSFL